MFGRWLPDCSSHLMLSVIFTYVFVRLCECVRRSWSRKLHYIKKNIGKSAIGNWKLKPVTRNFTGNRLTDNRITTSSVIICVLVCFCNSKWRTLHQPLVEEDFEVVLVTVDVVEGVDVGGVEAEEAGEVVVERKEIRNGFLLQSLDAWSKIWRLRPLRRSTFSLSPLRYVLSHSSVSKTEYMFMLVSKTNPQILFAFPVFIHSVLSHLSISSWLKVTSRVTTYTWSWILCCLYQTLAEVVRWAKIYLQIQFYMLDTYYSVQENFWCSKSVISCTEEFVTVVRCFLLLYHAFSMRQLCLLH